MVAHEFRELPCTKLPKLSRDLSAQKDDREPFRNSYNPDGSSGTNTKSPNIHFQILITPLHHAVPVFRILAAIRSILRPRIQEEDRPFNRRPSQYTRLESHSRQRPVQEVHLKDWPPTAANKRSIQCLLKSANVNEISPTASDWHRLAR